MARFSAFLFGILAGGLLLILIFLVYSQGFFNSFNINGGAVIKEVQKLNRWETARYSIEKIISKGDDKKGVFSFLFGDKILLIASGEVVAGFDFQTLNEKDLTITGKEVKINIGQPLILSSKLDNSKTRVYDRSTGIFTKGDKNLEKEARNIAEQEIRSAACASGILRTAAENGKKQLVPFLAALGFTSVTVTTTPSLLCK